MTIRHFQIFKAVCDSEGITAAAERLNITQPSVSIAIKELEVFYNTQLFDRLNRKIYLTEAGKILRAHVESMLDQYEEAELILRNGAIVSKCRLGVNVSFAETHLPNLISDIQKALPDCVLQVTVCNNEHLEHMLSDNQIDFAICDGLSERSTKHVEYLLEETVMALCAPTFYAHETITLEGLSSYPLLLHEEGSGSRSSLNRAFLSHGLPQKIIVESTSTLGLLDLAGSGLGFAFAPVSLAERFCADGNLRMVGIEDKRIRRIYYLAYHENKHLTKTMLNLKELVCHLRYEKEKRGGI